MERYEFVRKLAEGSFGAVWQGKDKQTGQVVAIKRMKNLTPPGSAEYVSARREVTLLDELRHTNIVQLLEAFQSGGGRLYLVFEYVDLTLLALLQHARRTSREVQAAAAAAAAEPQAPSAAAAPLLPPSGGGAPAGGVSGGLPEALVQSVMWQLLQAVSFMHDNKVIHRDIKPSNILISGSGTVKLCDFGFARPLDGNEVADYTTYVVTRWYRAPEVLVGDAYGPPVDVWSIGCIFAELLTGRVLFPGLNNIDQLWLVLQSVRHLGSRQNEILETAPDFRCFRRPLDHEYVSLEEGFSHLPAPALQLLLGCLHPDPEQRPTAAQLLQLPYFEDVRAALPSDCSSPVSGAAREPQPPQQQQPLHRRRATMDGARCYGAGAGAAAGAGGSPDIEFYKSAPGTRRPAAAAEDADSAVHGTAAAATEGPRTPAAASAAAEREGAPAVALPQLKGAPLPLPPPPPPLAALQPEACLYEDPDPDAVEPARSSAPAGGNYGSVAQRQGLITGSPTDFLMGRRMSDPSQMLFSTSALGAVSRLPAAAAAGRRAAAAPGKIRGSLLSSLRLDQEGGQQQGQQQEQQQQQQQQAVGWCTTVDRLQAQMAQVQQQLQQQAKAKGSNSLGAGAGRGGAAVMLVRRKAHSCDALLLSPTGKVATVQGGQEGATADGGAAAAAGKGPRPALSATQRSASLQPPRRLAWLHSPVLQQQPKQQQQSEVKAAPPPAGAAAAERPRATRGLPTGKAAAAGAAATAAALLPAIREAPPARASMSLAPRRAGVGVSAEPPAPTLPAEPATPAAHAHAPPPSAQQAPPRKAPHPQSCWAPEQTPTKHVSAHAPTGTPAAAAPAPPSVAPPHPAPGNPHPGPPLRARPCSARKPPAAGLQAQLAAPPPSGAGRTTASRCV